MRTLVVLGGALALACIGFGAARLAAAEQGSTLAGAAAYGDWRSDAPGVRRKLTPADMPAPLASRPAANPSRVVAQPPGALLKVPPGFAISLFATGLEEPRVVRVAPNGDIFVAESGAGRVRVLRADDKAPASSASEVFASNLDRPFGIAFYPPGPNPGVCLCRDHHASHEVPLQERRPQAVGAAEAVGPALPGGGGHWTRDIVFSADAKTMFVSVGSASNIGQEMGPLRGAELATFEAKHGLGAAWGAEENRADVLAFDPDGGNMRVFAAGLRNCSGLAVQPDNAALWCAVNERDIMGDDLPPDYATSVKEGGFYGWPWYYIGANEDPRRKGERPDLAGKTAVPDVLIQPHSAPLGITFYNAAQFPKDYQGDAFVALHGSWNRAKRTGYKVIRLIFKEGKPTGEYEDFLIGFVANDASVWGRPVGVAVAKDGSLLVTDDGGGAVWRVAYKGP